MQTPQKRKASTVRGCGPRKKQKFDVFVTNREEIILSAVPSQHKESFLVQEQYQDESFETDADQKSTERKSKLISQLISKNKLNAKNAFDVPMMELQDIQKLSFGEKDSTWKRLSSALENDYKIYSYRVDAVSSDAQCMLESIARCEYASESAEQRIPAHIDAGLNISSVHTSYDYHKFLEQNLRNINVNPLQTCFNFNPMLYCNRKKFNVTGLNWLFMNAIPLQDLELKVNFTYKDCAIRSSLKMPNSVGEVDALFEAMSEQIPFGYSSLTLFCEIINSDNPHNKQENQVTQGYESLWKQTEASLKDQKGMRNNRNSSDFNNVPMQEMVSTELSPMCLRDTEVSQDLPNKLNGDDQLGDCEHMMNPFLTQEGQVQPKPVSYTLQFAMNQNTDKKQAIKSISSLLQNNQSEPDKPKAASKKKIKHKNSNNPQVPYVIDFQFEAKQKRRHIFDPKGKQKEIICQVEKQWKKMRFNNNFAEQNSLVEDCNILSPCQFNPIKWNVVSTLLPPEDASLNGPLYEKSLLPFRSEQQQVIDFGQLPRNSKSIREVKQRIQIDLTAFSFATTFKSTYTQYVMAEGYISPALCLVALLHVANDQGLLFRSIGSEEDFSIVKI